MEKQTNSEAKPVSRRKFLKLMRNLLVGTVASAAFSACGVPQMEMRGASSESTANNKDKNVEDLSTEELIKLLPETYHNVVPILFEHLQFAKMSGDVTGYMESLRLNLHNDKLVYAFKCVTAYDLLLNLSSELASSHETNSQSENSVSKEDPSTNEIINTNCQISIESNLLAGLNLFFEPNRVFDELGVLRNFLPAAIKIVDEISLGEFFDHELATITYRDGGLIEIWVEKILADTAASDNNVKIDYLKLVGIIKHEIGHWLDLSPNFNNSKLKVELIALRLRFARQAIEEWFPIREQDETLSEHEKFFSKENFWTGMDPDTLSTNPAILLALVAEVSHKLLDPDFLCLNPIIKKYSTVYHQQREQKLEEFLDESVK